MKKRIDWIDQVKAWAIFLVVYGHNFPITEKYIYTFHMPLFFMIAGFFHPRRSGGQPIIRRAKGLLIPYFAWASILYVFWYFVGRHFGESSGQELSAWKNFIGIFYAQGGREYMNWGIPLWFLPAIFITFLLFHFILKTGKLKHILLVITIAAGFIAGRLCPVKCVWSIDVAMVALAFYAAGFYIFDFLMNLDKKKALLLLIVSGLIHIGLYFLNTKVDMYRSIYGNELVFLLNGWAGSLFYLLLFKLFIRWKALSYIGKFTIPILAMQLRAMTVIKAFLFFVIGRTVLELSEPEKFIYAIIQIIIMIPVFYIIEKYLPFLNGSPKKT